MFDSDEYVDVEAIVDCLSAEEDAADMHFSAYSIPSYWKDNPVKDNQVKQVNKLKESMYEN